MGLNPLSASALNATAIEDVVSSMSTAPLPHTMSPTSSPPNGSRSQFASFTGTTSRCPIRHSDGAFGSDPSIRATIEPRPGIDS